MNLHNGTLSLSAGDNLHEQTLGGNKEVGGRGGQFKTKITSRATISLDDL